MKFTKMQGAGNDFIILCRHELNLPESNFPALARRLCARHFSIGADGLMIVDAPHASGDFRMMFYNADGSCGEMCGNGARCIARYGYEHGLSGDSPRIETASGLVRGRRLSRDIYEVRLNPLTLLDLDRRVLTGGEIWETPYAELGSPGLPHAAVRLDGWTQWPEDRLLSLGSSLRNAPSSRKEPISHSGSRFLKMSFPSAPLNAV